jgi:hypothetical protein
MIPQAPARKKSTEATTSIRLAIDTTRFRICTTSFF